jgi:hypothetical protein
MGFGIPIANGIANPIGIPIVMGIRNDIGKGLRKGLKRLADVLIPLAALQHDPGPRQKLNHSADSVALEGAEFARWELPFDRLDEPNNLALRVIFEIGFTIVGLRLRAFLDGLQNLRPSSGLRVAARILEI